MVSFIGSAGRRAAPGDILIIASFAVYDEAELATQVPALIYVDAQNRIVRIGHAIPVQDSA
jgi:aspartate 1-decarboxylase